MRLFLAILIGKLIIIITRTLKIGGGSAAPGLYALKIEPKLIEKLSQKIPRNIIVTGTNGKTTTARMLAHLAKASGLKTIRNHTGSNLERGIASSLISDYTLTPRPYTLDLGIWELDEFAFNSVVKKIKSDVILFLNVSRDQLDRYGEVDKIIDRWSQTISKLDSKTVIFINSELGKLKKSSKDIKEFEKPKNIKLNGIEGSSFQLTINNSQLTINLPVPGEYNISNAVAAISAAQCLNMPVGSLDSFEPAFGRVEKIEDGFIFLIKNPEGATQVFETITPELKSKDRLLIALNDNFADGTDVSWIWDAEFEKLKVQSAKCKVFCSGTRANDLAVRLKYAGVDTANIHIESNLQDALREARKDLEGRLFILPTYTALLELQAILEKQGKKPHYWKED